MKRTGLILLLLAAAAALSFGQSSMMSTGNSNGSAADMTSSNSSSSGANSMMSANSSSGGANSMMSANSGGESSTTMMSANPMRADPKVGHELRYAPSTGTKIIFTTLEAAEALAAKQPTVLFFAADWCPYCQADLKDINAHGSRLGNIAIVVADYDKTAKLKMKYGITVQDTFVQINAMGGEVAVWTGGGVEGILSHVMRS